MTVLGSYGYLGRGLVLDKLMVGDLESARVHLCSVSNMLFLGPCKIVND